MEGINVPGIAGFIGKTGMHPSDVHHMVQSMMHEQHYVSGEYSDPEMGVGVGWAGLSEIFSNTPVWNAKRDVVLFFSGENFAGDTNDKYFRVYSNAEIIVQLYERYGQEFVNEINGWFCGIIVDYSKPCVIIFNDRYGLGRIYTKYKNDCLYFSSEAKALLRIIGDGRELDWRGVAETIACGATMQNRTLFSGMSLMPPGSIWRFEPGAGLREERYFSPSEWEQQTPLGKDEFYQEMKETFQRILPRYLAASRIGMSLTGGLDGRMILAAAKPATGSLPCYTFNGPYRESADLRLAKRIATNCHQPHETISIDDDFFAQFCTLAQKAVYISDGTMDATGAVELYVNKLARNIAPIRLTGNYGSEVIRRNVAFRMAKFGFPLFDPEIDSRIDEASSTYNEEINCPRMSFIAFKQVPWHHYARLSVEQSQLIVRSPYLDNELVGLMYRAPAVFAESKECSMRLVSDLHPALARIPTDRGELYGDLSYARIAHVCLAELMVKAEYAYDYGMPPRLSAFDRLLAPFHPERIFLGRQKFYHFRVWYRDQLAGYLKEVLLDPRSLSRPHLRPGALERMVHEHTTGARNWTRELHRALTLELTQRTLIETSG